MRRAIRATLACQGEADCEGPGQGKSQGRRIERFCTRREAMPHIGADDGRIELRAVTKLDYDCIWDNELVSAAMKIAGHGVGDARWKMPGLLN